MNKLINKIIACTLIISSCIINSYAKFGDNGTNADKQTREDIEANFAIKNKVEYWNAAQGYQQKLLKSLKK